MRHMQKRIDFYAVYRQGGPRAKKSSRKLGKILLPVLAAVLLVAAWGGLTLDRLRLKSQLDEVTGYLQSSAVTLKLAQANSLQEKISSALADKEALQQAAQNIASYPDYTSTARQKVNDCLGDRISVKGLAFDASLGAVVVTGTSASANDAAAFAAALRETGFFADITYIGYAADNSWTYEFSMTAQLKGVQ